jgi:hypothetical protein
MAPPVRADDINGRDISKSLARIQSKKPKSIIDRHSSLAGSKTLRSPGGVKGVYSVGSPFPTNCLNESGGIFSHGVVSSGTIKEHFERLEIMIHRLHRDFE